jgi:hypothetical protein
MSNPDLIDGFVRHNFERAQAARELQKIVSRFPELLDDLLRLYRPMANAAQANGVRPGVVGRRAGTAFERIARVFLQNGNEWIDTSEMVKRSAVTRNVAATVLWKAHRADFEQREHATHARMKIWRLTPDAFDRLKKQARLFEDETKEGA